MAAVTQPVLTRSRIRTQNAAYAGAGALNGGDRGAGQYIPMYTGNPYESNDFVYRWRQYVHLYETSWEARKIVRIPIEDALRKDWEIQGIPAEIAKKIKFKLDKLQFRHIIGRSMMLERLLGGCLTFMGLESNEDKPESVFHPNSKKDIKFLNAIPVSRISRTGWNTDPLSEHYMRPDTYLINGNKLHVSRCLVWDGEPLFDPYDFALTNFRANLAGFGPSKLACIWDDIVKAVGTRQAAYQLIQTNNTLIAAVNNLADLQGTTSGRKALDKVKEVANQISVYRAAIIDGEDVKLSQHSASFGSVPELMLTFIQILSAASDIPATRFLGQAPGGLNATGESDLENYYNVIDALQRQRIEPALRRTIDIIGYNATDQWKKLREGVTINFPPLWNQTELEEAQTHQTQIDNAMKLWENNLISDQNFIDEINSKGALSVELDNTDIGIRDDAGVDEAGPGEEVDIDQQISRLKSGIRPNDEHPTGANQAEDDHSTPSILPLVTGGVKKNDGVKSIQTKQVTTNKGVISRWSKLISLAGADPLNIDLTEFVKGFSVEQEHSETVGGDEVIIAKIVLDHLSEDKNYYIKLAKIENGMYIFNTVAKRKGKWLVLSHNGKVLATEKTKTEANERLREIERFKKQNSIDLARLPTPTDKQKHAGNYKKHHIEYKGMRMAIENPKGSERSGVDENGKEWRTILPAHYGYIKNTTGADGDHVDAYVGNFDESDNVYLIDQIDPDTKEFDEHKCIFGCLSSLQAVELYVSAFSDGKGPERIGAINPMDVQQFKEWLAAGDQMKPFSETVDDKFKPTKRVRNNRSIKCL